MAEDTIESLADQMGKLIDSIEDKFREAYSTSASISNFGYAGFEISFGHVGERKCLRFRPNPTESWGALKSAPLQIRIVAAKYISWLKAELERNNDTLKADLQHALNTYSNFYNSLESKG